MISESVVAAAPIAADTWTAVGSITVPAGVASIKKVVVSFVPDAGTAGATVHSAPVFRMIGSGCLEQSPHEYAAQGSDIPLIAATAGYAIAETNIMEYDVDIPVAVGGVIDIQCNSLDEVQTGTARAELVFSAEAAAASNSMSQYVDSAIPAAADTWSAVGTITVPQLAQGNSPKKITGVVCGFVPDVAATAVSERVSVRFRLSGSGLVEGGNHHLLSTGAGNGCVVTGPGVYQNCLIKREVEIPVNAGGQILVEQWHDTELCDGGTAVFHVKYE